MVHCIVSRLPDRGPRIGEFFSGKDRRKSKPPDRFWDSASFLFNGEVSCFQASKAAVE
jgi:hypothetical protein